MSYPFYTNIRSISKLLVNSIPDTSTIFIIGEKKSGKSFLILDILRQKDIPEGIVISENTRLYSSFLPKHTIIYKNYDPTIINNLFNEQLSFMQDKSYDSRVFVCLEYCGFYDDDDSILYDKSIRSLIRNGRKHNILSIIEMPYDVAISTKLLNSVDYIFILKSTTMKERKCIYSQYGRMFPSFEQFNFILDQCTDRYECLVIHNNANKIQLEDMLYWYKAQIPTTDDESSSCDEEDSISEYKHDIL